MGIIRQAPSSTLALSSCVTKYFLQDKAVEATKQKEGKRTILSPRNGKACHNVITALVQNVAETSPRVP
jgi:hypothetical protein